jgi:hypothetical protein
MTEQRPIKSPSLAIIKKWIIANGLTVSIVEASAIASLASRLGADQELEACCEWMDNHLFSSPSTALRAVRRPKSSSLKEQALQSVKRFEESGEFFSDQMRELEFIRKALETLDD